MMFVYEQRSLKAKTCVQVTKKNSIIVTSLAICNLSIFETFVTKPIYHNSIKVKYVIITIFNKSLKRF